MIYTGPLSAFDDVMETHHPSHVVSLLSPDMMIETDPRLTPDTHLRLKFNDISSEKTGLIAPGKEHISQLIRFVKDWSSIEGSDRRPLFIQCYAGISRSPAASYIALCLLNPEVDESNLARALRSINHYVTPNPMMIRYADALLSRDGRMISAIDQIGRGKNAWEGEVFPLPLYFPKHAQAGTAQDGE